MTHDREKLRQLAERATKGPWQYHGSHLYGPDMARALIAQVLSDGGYLVPDRDIIVAAVNALPSLLDEIERLHARLETPAAPFEAYDGISCRDETIKQQDAQITRLKADLAEAKEALAALLGEIDSTSTFEGWAQGHKPLTDTIDYDVVQKARAAVSKEKSHG